MVVRRARCCEGRRDWRAAVGATLDARKPVLVRRRTAREIVPTAEAQEASLRRPIALRHVPVALRPEHREPDAGSVVITGNSVGLKALLLITRVYDRQPGTRFMGCHTPGRRVPRDRCSHRTNTRGCWQWRSR